MTQENKNNKVEATPEEQGFFASSWEIIKEPGAWISKKTAELKKDAAAYAVNAVGEELGVSKEFTTGIVGMLKGTNQADGIMGLLGQSAVRGGAFWMASAALANVLKFVSGGNLDLTGSLPIIAAVTGMLITGFKQYNANHETINKDVSEKVGAVADKAGELKEGAVEFLNNTGITKNETVQQVLNMANIDVDSWSKKAEQFDAEQVNNKQPKLSGPSPV